MNRLTGNVAIITGGAVGVGRACVHRIAEEGAKVAIFDVLEPAGKSLAAEMTAKGHDVGFWSVNVTKEAAIKLAIDAVADQLGGLHVLVNNAEISGSSKPTDEVMETEWDRVQAVNAPAQSWCRVCNKPIVHRWVDWRRRYRALSRLERRSAVNVEVRCHHL